MAKIKKIIAREGLIVLGIISIGFILRFIGTSGHPFSEWIDVTSLNFLDGFGRIIIISGYPLYLLIRFIFWAIRTLKQN